MYLLPERIIPIRSTSAVFQIFDCPIIETAIDAKFFIQDISQDFIVLKAELVFQNNSLLGIIILKIRGGNLHINEPNDPHKCEGMFAFDFVKNCFIISSP